MRGQHHQGDLVQTDAAMALHWRVAQLFRDSGIRSLVLKGPSTAALLYAGERRDYGDADVLVDANDRARAVAVLLEAGFVSAEGGFRVAERPSHAETFLLEPSGPPLDLHVEIPGCEAAPSEQWVVLSACARPLELPGFGTVEAPAPEAVALICCLHAARNGFGDNLSSMDLRRALQRLDDETWRATFALAMRLKATGALLAGLDLLPAGRAVHERWAPQASPSRTWSQHAALARGPRRLAELRGLSSKARWRRLVQDAFPSASFLRRSSALARRGGPWLWLAYAARLIRLALRAQRDVRALRAHRRGS